MELSKDVYEHMTNFADDATILSMLSVNKKFNDEIFFQRVLARKYPHLLNFRKEGETYKQLFIRMTYYIAKNKEEFNMPYLDAKSYNPETFYKKRKRVNKIDIQSLPQKASFFSFLDKK